MRSTNEHHFCCEIIGFANGSGDEPGNVTHLLMWLDIVGDVHSEEPKSLVILKYCQDSSSPLDAPPCLCSMWVFRTLLGMGLHRIEATVRIWNGEVKGSRAQVAFLLILLIKGQVLGTDVTWR